jgi:hypothetical protein
VIRAAELCVTIEGIETTAARTWETDVSLSGDWLVDGEQSSRYEPARSQWFNALSLPWYTERSRVE